MHKNNCYALKNYSLRQRKIGLTLFHEEMAKRYRYELSMTSIS